MQAAFPVESGCRATWRIAQNPHLPHVFGFLKDGLCQPAWFFIV
jgi:hypothetical protein